MGNKKENLLFWSRSSFGAQARTIHVADEKSERSEQKSRKNKSNLKLTKDKNAQPNSAATVQTRVRTAFYFQMGD